MIMVVHVITFHTYVRRCIIIYTILKCPFFQLCMTLQKNTKLITRVTLARSFLLRSNYVKNIFAPLKILLVITFYLTEIYLKGTIHRSQILS